jgi:hypothetical protein
MNLLVNIDVDNLEKGARFYCDALGLRIGRRFEGAVELLGLNAPIYLLESPMGRSRLRAVRVATTTGTGPRCTSTSKRRI